MIRKDIFAVKEYDGTQGGWCFVRMTRSQESAIRYAKDIMRSHCLVIVRKAKIVHPSQKIVDAFILAGNTIED